MTPARIFINSFAAAAIAAAASLAKLPSALAANFDGNWSVLIVTRSGPCDPVSLRCTIQNGVVIYNGSAPVNVVWPRQQQRWRRGAGLGGLAKRQRIRPPFWQRGTRQLARRQFVRHMLRILDCQQALSHAPVKQSPCAGARGPCAS